MKVTVLGDRVLIRPDAQPTETESGLHLVYDRQQSTMRGAIVAVGTGIVTKTGVTLPHVVTPGERVIFSPDSGTELMFEKEILICMKEADVLAVVEN